MNSPAATPRARISPAARARLEFAAKAFIVVSFLGAATSGVVRLQQKAFADPAHRVDLGAWTVVERPAWATVDDVRAVRDASRLRGWSASLLHDDAGPVVRRSIEAAPQVVRVAGLRKRFPNEFEAVIELRRPVAAVATGTGAAVRWVEVDEEGRALTAPLAVRPVRDGRALRAVTGWAGHPPATGATFPAEIVEAADLAAELDRYGTDEDRALLETLDEIDVSNHGARARPDASEVVLRKSGASPVSAAGRAASRPSGTRRCDVEWGRFRPVDAYDPEAPFGAKAARVVQALRMFPGLDGLATVKVAFSDLIVVPAPGSPLTRK